MDKFEILVSHLLTITSLLNQLPLECECKSLVCLLKRPTLLSFDFQDHSIKNYSFGESAVKRRVKFKTKKKGKKKKNVWLTVFQKKGTNIHVTPFLKVFFLREKSELSRTGVVRLNSSIENPLNVSNPWKFIFREPAQFLSFLPCYKVMTKDNHRYLRALHRGNERHHAWPSKWT